MYSLFQKRVTRDSDTRDLVFALLSQTSGQNIAELTRLIHKQYRLKLTYHAVRKAARRLYDENVISVDKGRYSINRTWLLEVKRKIDSILLESRGQRDKSLSPNQASSSAQGTYTLNSLFELDNFWADTVLAHCATLGRSKKPTHTAITHYTWWMLINLGQETKYWQTMMNYCQSTSMVILKKNPLNLWAARIYKHIGAHCTVKTDTTSDDAVHYNMMDDFVIQVRLPEQAMKRIRLCYEKYKRMEQIESDYVLSLAHAKYEITFNVYRDPILAQNLLRAYGLAPRRTSAKD